MVRFLSYETSLKGNHLHPSLPVVSILTLCRIMWDEMQPVLERPSTMSVAHINSCWHDVLKSARTPEKYTVITQKNTEPLLGSEIRQTSYEALHGSHLLSDANKPTTLRNIV